MPTPSKPCYRKDRIVSDGTFKLHSRFRSILPSHRLQWLIREAAKGSEMLPWDRLRQMRRGFDRHKVSAFPMGETCACWCCGGEARIRHHVLPLSKGGRNKRNNVVPLCDSCHVKVHPHMASRHSIEEIYYKLALGPPDRLIVVIPPKI